MKVVQTYHHQRPLITVCFYPRGHWRLVKTMSAPPN